MTKKRPSAASAKRLRAEHLQAAQQPVEVPEPIRVYLDQYRAAGIEDDIWAIVGPAVRELVAAAGYTGEEAVKKHCGALSNYLAWRHRQHLPVDVEHAMTHEAIDAYYLHGLDTYAPGVRNDYRSRLHSLASRVNPGLTAPTITTAGYVSIRPGYTLAEEAVIIRVALRQRRPLQRRQLCAIVGLCGGAGVDPRERSHMDRSHIDDRGEHGGIWVTIPGDRPRIVVVRREYEPLVRVGIAGLQPNALLIGRTRGRSGSVSSAIDDTEVFEDCPRIEARRLRTTWLTWLVTNRVPLNVILSAAGLTSARSLTDLIAALPPSEPGDLLRNGGAS
jgi:hypothetical protein